LILAGSQKENLRKERERNIDWNVDKVGTL